MQTEQSIGCPYCGECIDILVDESAGNQHYVEDCQVCCRPIEIGIHIDAYGSLTADVKTDAE
ncbi:MAG: CPXCG motif-containing cysteine-rich protein [Pseudomonadota bacterium]